MTLWGTRFKILRVPPGTNVNFHYHATNVHFANEKTNIFRQCFDSYEKYRHLSVIDIEKKAHNPRGLIVADIQCTLEWCTLSGYMVYTFEKCLLSREKTFIPIFIATYLNHRPSCAAGANRASALSREFNLIIRSDVRIPLTNWNVAEQQFIFYLLYACRTYRF